MREEKPDAQDRCRRELSGELVRRLKQFKFTPRIEPGSSVFASEHTCPTPPLMPKFWSYIFCKGLPH